MKKLIKMLSLVSVMVLVAPVASAKNAEDIYKEKYKEQAVQMLKVTVTPKLKEMGKTDAEIQTVINNTVDKLAVCQVKSIQGYDERYLNAAYEVVTSGGSLADSNAKVNELIMGDISSGKIGREVAAKQIEEGANFMQQCGMKALQSSIQ